MTEGFECGSGNAEGGIQAHVAEDRQQRSDDRERMIDDG